MMKDIYKEKLLEMYKKNMTEVAQLLENKDAKLLKKIDSAEINYGIDKEYLKKKIKEKEPIALAFFSIDPTKQNFYEKTAAKLLKKIDSAEINYGIDKEYLKKKIKEKEPIALAFFSIDPTKQNFYEKTAAEFLQKIRDIKNFKNLPNSEKYLSRGSIIDKPEFKNLSNAKSIDFQWEYNNFQIYASHKYTKESGGAQAYSYKDVKLFIEEARDNKIDNIKFLAICDGAYYKQLDTKSSKTRIENLQLMCTKCVKVCNICEVEKSLKEF